MLVIHLFCDCNQRKEIEIVKLETRKSIIRSLDVGKTSVTILSTDNDVKGGKSFEISALMIHLLG